MAVLPIIVAPDPRLKIKAKPVDGAANQAVIKFIAAEFGVKANRVRITSGFTSRIKYLEIDTEI